MTIEINDDLGHAYDWMIEEQYSVGRINMTLNRQWAEAWHNTGADNAVAEVLATYFHESEECI